VRCARQEVCLERGNCLSAERNSGSWSIASYIDVCFDVTYEVRTGLVVFTLGFVDFDPQQTSEQITVSTADESLRTR